MKPSNFQIDSIKFIVKYYPALNPLCHQIPLLELIDIEHTGVGCCYSYRVNNNNPAFISSIKEDLILNDGFQVKADELPSTAALTLRITNGKIDSLDILAHGSHFPKADPHNYIFEKVIVNYIDRTGKKEN